MVNRAGSLFCRWGNHLQLSGNMKVDRTPPPQFDLSLTGTSYFLHCCSSFPVWNISSFSWREGRSIFFFFFSWTINTSLHPQCLLVEVSSYECLSTRALNQNLLEKNSARVMCQCGICGVGMLVLGPSSTLILHPVGWRGELLELHQRSTTDAEENHFQSRFVLVVIDFTWNTAQPRRGSRKSPKKLVDLRYKTGVQPTACVWL